MTAVSRFTQISLAALALAFSSAIALAQAEGPLQEVEITAFKTVAPSSHGATWRQVETIQLSRGVSYADLDLTTESGAAELRQRVRNTAKEVCQQLQREHPFANETDLPFGSCVEEAIHDAMVETNAVISAAEKARAESTEAHPQ